MLTVGRQSVVFYIDSTVGAYFCEFMWE